MFSKLVFTAGTQHIEFHLHELVKIADAVIEATPSQEVQAMPHHVWDFIYDDVLDFGTYFEELSKDTLDPILFIPPHTSQLNHPHQWLSVLPEIKRVDPQSPLIEWWFLIAGRLISVKNKNRCDVYLFLKTATDSARLS